MKNDSIIKLLFSNKALVITFILLLGLVFASGNADVASIKQGQTGVFGSGKMYRIISVFVAASLAFLYVFQSGSRGISALFRGNLALISSYTLLAIMTVVFSQLKSMTLFKSFEMVIICMICAILLTNNERSKYIKVFIIGVFLLYTLSSFSALLETVFFGGKSNRAIIVGDTPLLDAMLQSTYPPLAANAVGFLGALTGLFGMYLFDISNGKRFNKILSALIFIVGTTVLFLSYTRSVLVYFLLCVLYYSYLERKFLRLISLTFLVFGLLVLPSTQDKIIAHMKRGSSDENISNLSGRTVFWENVFSRDPVQLLVGEGYATGTLFQDYDTGGKGKIFANRNAHNSMAEIVMSSGFVGLFIWLTLLYRIYKQLMYARRKLRWKQSKSELHFHNFILATFALSILRTLTNSSMVYLDYFMFMLVIFAVYSESMRSDLLKEKQKSSTQKNGTLSTKNKNTVLLKK